MSGRRSPGPLPVLGGLLALYLFVPVVVFAVRVASSPQRGFGTPGLWSALEVSLVSATISLGVISLFGIPLAYGLARRPGRLSSAISLVTQLPLALPPLMSGILLIFLFGPYTTLGRLFGGHLTETLVGVVLAQTFVAAPFLIAIARSAFSDIDPALFDVAATLGYSRTSRFLRIAVPAASDGIRAGMLLAWLRAFGEYGATSILAYHPYTLSVFTDIQFGGVGLPNTLGPTALALIAAAVVIVLVRLPLHLPSRSLPAPGPAVEPKPSPYLPVRFALDLAVGEFRLDLAHAAASPHLAILGPSGAGKSLTLRCLAGILSGPGTVVAFGDRDVSAVPTEHRRIGYVPQSLALLPRRPVARQVVAGIGSDAALATYWLGRLHIEHLAGRLPEELSGGERQRVCLAQALARSPELLLLDEPFSALDAPVRSEMRQMMRELQREIGISTVLVTHDPEEAAMLAEEVLVIAGGRLLQAGSRAEVFGRPASPEVARLLGATNLLPGHYLGAGRIRSGDLEFAVATADLPLGPITWSIRSEQVRIDASGSLTATIDDHLELAGTTELVLRMGDDALLRARTPSSALRVGEICRFDLPAESVQCWGSV